MADDNYSLVMAFPDQSPGFAQGFACGRIWQEMSDEKAVITGTLVSETRATVEAMAMARGWTEKIEDVSDGWISVRLENPNQETLPQTANIDTAPYHQRVVIFGVMPDGTEETAMAWKDRANDRWFYAPQGGLVMFTVQHWSPIPRAAER